MFGRDQIDQLDRVRGRRRFDQGEIEYHRPVDTLEAIEPDKLEAVGRIVGLTALGLSEADPALDDLLGRRAAAAMAGDLDAFLATSLPGQDRGAPSPLSAMCGTTKMPALPEVTRTLIVSMRLGSTELKSASRKE